MLTTDIFKSKTDDDKEKKAKKMTEKKGSRKNLKATKKTEAKATEAKKKIGKTKEEEKKLTPQEKAIASAVEQIDKAFGKGSIRRMGDAPIEVPEVTSTGSRKLNKALGIGGYPKGRIIELLGLYSSGKSTLSLHAIAEVQKQGGKACFIDAEHALDPTWAEKIGVDVDDLYIAQPDYGEQALSILEKLVSSGGFQMAVVDSVAALVPKAELDGEMGDHHVALLARMMSQAMRKLTALANKTGTTILFLNQIRQKVGVVFGSKNTTTGGEALKFYSSIRLDLARIGTVKEGDEAIANKTRVKVVKNKLAAPFKQAEFEIDYRFGITVEGEVIDEAVEKKVIDKNGHFYYYNEEKLGQGKNNTITFLRENDKLLQEIVRKIDKIEG